MVSLKKFVMLFVLMVSVLVLFFPYKGYTKTWTPEQAEVIKVMEEWQTAYENNDFETMDRLLDENIHMESTSLGGTFNDKKSYLEALKKYKSDTKRKLCVFHMKVTYEDVKIVNNDRAFVVKTIDVIQLSSCGVRPYKRASVKETELRKKDGQWKIYSEKNL